MTESQIKKTIISLTCLLVLAYSGFAQEKADISNKSKNQVNEAMMTDSPHEDDFYIAKARDYMEKHKDYLQITNLQQELKFKNIMRDPPPFTNVTVSFYQVVNNIPVERAIIGISFRQNGKVFSSGSLFEPGARHVNTTPSITKKQAADIALKDKRATGTAKADIVDLAIDKFNNEFKLVWKIALGGRSSSAIPGQFYIDAHSGEILKYEPLFIVN